MCYKIFLILHFIIISSVDKVTGCEGIEVDNVCYWVENGTTGIKPLNRLCAEKGGNLAAIPNEDVNAKLKESNLFLNITEKAAWLAAYDGQREGVWSTWFGDSLEWTNWSPDTRNDQDCVAFNQDGQFMDIDCGQAFLAVCQATKDNNCSEILKDDVCYWTTAYIANIHRSNAQCGSDNGSLSFFSSQEDFQKFFSEFSSDSMKENIYWTGINDIQEEGNYKSWDGSKTIKDLDWIAQNPDDSTDNVDCSVINTDPTSKEFFTWLIVPCVDSSPRPALCSRNLGTSSTTSLQKTSSSSISSSTSPNLVTNLSSVSTDSSTTVHSTTKETLIDNPNNLIGSDTEHTTNQSSASTDTPTTVDSTTKDALLGNPNNLGSNLVGSDPENSTTDSLTEASYISTAATSFSSLDSVRTTAGLAAGGDISTTTSMESVRTTVGPATAGDILTTTSISSMDSVRTTAGDAASDILTTTIISSLDSVRSTDGSAAVGDIFVEPEDQRDHATTPIHQAGTSVTTPLDQTEDTIRDDASLSTDHTMDATTASTDQIVDGTSLSNDVTLSTDHTKDAITTSTNKNVNGMIIPDDASTSKHPSITTSLSHAQTTQQSFDDSSVVATTGSLLSGTSQRAPHDSRNISQTTFAITNDLTSNTTTSQPNTTSVSNSTDTPRELNRCQNTSSINKTCICYNITSQETSGNDLQDRLDTIKTTLSVPHKQISAIIYKKESMPDPRASSQAMGLISIVTILVGFCAIVLGDFIQLLSQLKTSLKRILY